MAEMDAKPLLAHGGELREPIPGLTLTHLLIQGRSRVPPQPPALKRDDRGTTVIEYAEVNVAIALALSSDDAVVMVIRRADDR